MKRTYIFGTLYLYLAWLTPASGSEQVFIGNEVAVGNLDTETAGIRFDDNSSAGNANIRVRDGQLVRFVASSTAANATITVEGPQGRLLFADDSTGASARLIATDGGAIQLANDAGQLAVGSLEGDASIEYWSDFILTVGTNNRSTTFRGWFYSADETYWDEHSISLTKTGTGTLTLRGSESGLNGEIRIEQGFINFLGWSLGTGPITLDGGGLQWGYAENAQETEPPEDISSKLNPLGTNGGSFDTNGHDVTFANPVTGNGRLIKAGSGSLTLNGISTYTGGTVLTGGTLRAGTSGALPDGSYTLSSGLLDLNGHPLTMSVLSGSGGTISIGATTLTINQSTNTSFGGSFSGSGDITKSGTGTLSLTGDSSGFTGNTTVSAGQLVVGVDGNGRLGSNVSINNEASLSGSGTIGGNARLRSGARLAPGNSIGTLSIEGNLLLEANSMLDFEFGEPGGEFHQPGNSDRVQVGGNLQIDGARLNVSDVGGFGAGLYTLFSYGGSFSGSGLLQGTQPTDQQLSFYHAEDQKRLYLVNSTDLPINVWNANNQAGFGRSGGGSGVWRTNAAVWSDLAGVETSIMRPLPGFAIFTGEAGNVRIDSTDGAVEALGLQFVSNGYRLSGDPIRLTSTTTAQPEIRVGSNDADDTTVTAIIDSSILTERGLRKTGDGTLELSGNNAYQGTTTVSAGRLRAGSATSLPSHAPYAVDGGTLDLNGFDLTMSSLQGLQGELALGGARLTVDQTGDTTFSGVLSGNGQFIKAGAGTLELAGSASFQGSTEIQAGVLRQSSSNALPNGAAYILTAGTLDLGTHALTMSSLAGTSGTLLAQADLTLNQHQDTRHAGDISSSGRLIKNGAGTLALDGTARIDGGTAVNAGKLIVGSHADSQAVLQGPVEVHNNGLLGGHGRILGSVWLHDGATLSPGNSIGTLTIDGNLQLSGGSTLLVDVNASGQSDQLRLTDNALLAGSLAVQADAGAYPLATDYTLIDTSSGNLSGEFETIQSTQPFLDASLSQQGNRMVLTLTRNDVSFNTFAVSPNQLAFANSLNTLDEDHEIRHALARLDPDALGAAYANLSGDAHGSLASTLLYGSIDTMAAPGENLRQNLDSPATALPLWAQATGGRQRINSDGDAAAVVQDFSGVMVGGDLPAIGDWRFGAALGYDLALLNVSSRSTKGQTATQRYALYGGRNIDTAIGTFKVFGGAARSVHTLKSTRDVALGSQLQRLERKYDVAVSQVFGELAYLLDFGTNGSLEPFIGLMKISQTADAFSERGGSAALSASKQTHELVLSSLGVRGSRPLTLGGRDIELKGSFTWRHLTGDLMPEVELRLSGGDRYKVLGNELPRDSYLLSLNANYKIAPYILLHIGYNGMFSRASSANALSANVKWSFK